MIWTCIPAAVLGLVCIAGCDKAPSGGKAAAGSDGVATVDLLRIGKALGWDSDLGTAMAAARGD